MDGGGGLADVPEACHCFCPDQRPSHNRSITYLLG